MKTLIILLGLFLAPYNANAGFVVDQNLSLTATTTTTKILEGKKSRAYLIITNNGLYPIYVKVGAVQTAHEGIKIPVGGNWEPVVAPADAIYVSTATGSSAMYVLTGKEDK